MPKLLEEPQLLDIDEFYLNMYNTCGTDFKNIKEYCMLYSLNREEILESLLVIRKIHYKVKNASNTA